MISSHAVMRAVYDLGRSKWPTAPEIAAYLETDETEVRAKLLDLKRQRIFRDRRRHNRRVWMPWGSV